MIGAANIKINNESYIVISREASSLGCRDKNVSYINSYEDDW